MGRPEPSRRAHRRSPRGGVGPRALVDRFGLAELSAEEREGGGGETDTKAPLVEAGRVWAWKT